MLDDKMNIQVPVENSGTIEIKELRFDAIGSKKKISSSAQNLTVFPGEIFPKVIDFNTKENGELKEIIVTPKVAGKNNKLLTCNGKKLSVKEVKC
ncbi:MAG: hypothetical protein V1859_05925 [archaeon]